MKNAGVVLLILFVVAFGDLSVKKQEPEVADTELTSAEPISGPLSDSDESADDAIQENPPIEDFLALRQQNAELALQVEEMTSELRQLQHDKKMTMWRSKFTVSKIKRQCSDSPVEEDSAALDARNAKVTAGVAMMPWSLTHTATRHKMQSKFPGEGMFKDITNYFHDGSTAVQAVSNYLRKIPVLGKVQEMKKKEDEELEKIQAALKDARVRLGRNKEARHGLEDHYNALVGRIAQAKTQAESENAAMEQAVKAEHDLDKEIDKVKQLLNEKARTQYEQSPKRQAEVQNVSRSLHAEVERRMNESAKMLETLKTQNYQIQTAIEESNARQADKQMRVQNLKKSTVNMTAKLGALNTAKQNLMHEERDEEKRVALEDRQLMASSGQLESCDDWGKKLEKKLKKVIRSSKDDAKLCHKSILGLHGERVKLKQELHKQYTEIKRQKDNTASMEYKGDESLNMLNHCLGRLK